MAKLAGSIFSVDVTGLDAGRGKPAYARISDRIRTAIVSGALALNARLPSSRMLATDFGVARNTVEWALGQLVADEYIVRRRGAGSFVAARLPKHDLQPLARKHVAASKAGAAKRRLSERARALASYPGHYRPLSSVPFTPSLPPIDLFPRKVWNRLLHREGFAGRLTSRFGDRAAGDHLGAPLSDIRPGNSIAASGKVMTFIVTRDRAKAKTFYGDVLGFKQSSEDESQRQQSGVVPRSRRK
jgi:DNA-binding transcriptional regulator YhcF (GntR family)